MEHSILLHTPLAVIAMTIVAGCAVFARYVGKPRDKNTGNIGVLVYIMSYVLLVGGAFAMDAYIEWRVDSFDSDGNWMTNDVPREYLYLTEMMIQDTGRALAPFTGVVGALVTTLIALVIYKAGLLVRRFLFKGSAG